MGFSESSCFSRSADSVSVTGFGTISRDVLEPLLLPLAIPTTDAFPPPGFFYKTSEHGQEQLIPSAVPTRPAATYRYR